MEMQTQNQKGSSLTELSRQYDHAAQLQSEAIAETRRRYQALPDKFTGREAQRLRALLQTMYAQRRELQMTGAYLRHYYRFSKTNREGMQ